MIVSIGEPLVEFNQTAPSRKEYLQGFGGDSSNMVIAAARSGARAAYVTRIGDDAFGRMFLELWKSEGVDTSGVVTDAQAFTAAYFVTHGAQGHVFSYLRSGSAASRLRPTDLPADLMRRARTVHASGISLAISSSAVDTVFAAFHAARAGGAKVSFDSNLRLKLWPLARARAMIGHAAAGADYFFPSLEDARALSGLDDAQANLAWAHRRPPATPYGRRRAMPTRLQRSRPPDSARWNRCRGRPRWKRCYEVATSNAAPRAPNVQTTSGPAGRSVRSDRESPAAYASAARPYERYRRWRCSRLVASAGMMSVAKTR
jgi:hypothetical protein